MTALTSAVTAWSEFSNAGRKLEIFSSTTGELHNLITWWDALGEIDKGSPKNINTLIFTGEAIISNEQLAWSSKPTLSETADALMMNTTVDSDGAGAGEGARLAGVADAAIRRHREKRRLWPRRAAPEDRRWPSLRCSR